MPLVIKSNEEDVAEVTPHLALTHNELQGGAANQRNVSLLMKSDVEMTEEVVKALTELGLVVTSPVSTAGVDSETLEASGDDAVIIKTKEEVITLQEEIKKAVEAAEALLKAQVQEKDEQLQKALGQLAQYEVEKKEAVVKARTAAIAEVEKDVEAAEALLKSLEAVSDESFAVIIKSLKAKEEKLEDSDLFVQKSRDASQEEVSALDMVGALINKNKKQ
jgi:hypothetical protein